MSDMKCPICGEMLQKYGEVDPDTGTSIVLGANCPECGIGDSDIKLWQELIRTREELHKANAELDYIKEQVEKSNAFIHARIKVAAEQIARGIIDQVKIIKEQKE